MALRSQRAFIKWDERERLSYTYSYPVRGTCALCSLRYCEIWIDVNWMLARRTTALPKPRQITIIHQQTSIISQNVIVSILSCSRVCMCTIGWLLGFASFLFIHFVFLFSYVGLSASSWIVLHLPRTYASASVAVPCAVHTVNFRPHCLVWTSQQFCIIAELHTLTRRPYLECTMAVDGGNLHSPNFTVSGMCLHFERIQYA